MIRFLLALALALAGCATQSPALIFAQRGEVAPNAYLANVTVVALASVRDICLNGTALACTTRRMLPDGTVTIGLTFPLPPDFTVTQCDVDLLAHELCHAMALAQQITPDPCHKEDKGVAASCRRRKTRIIFR